MKKKSLLIVAVIAALTMLLGVMPVAAAEEDAGNDGTATYASALSVVRGDISKSGTSIYAMGRAVKDSTASSMKLTIYIQKKVGSSWSTVSTTATITTATSVALSKTITGSGTFRLYLVAVGYYGNNKSETFTKYYYA